MRIVQFEVPGQGRRLGVVQDGVVRDVTSLRPDLTRVVQAFAAARSESRRLAEFLEPLAASASTSLPYAELLAAAPGGSQPFLHPPLDHPDGHCLLISGTGLTHLGSMQSRDQMHSETKADHEGPKSDSKKMFEMGLQGGRPPTGQRGAAPEWFFKGNGANLRGPRQTLEVPSFALDGGEEPEIVGCYAVDREGVPCRLGFALGNEWSDHATENINYLYLAPSKLRQCSVGPELITDCEFQEIELRLTVTRGGRVIYDSGPLWSGERHMSHTLANCEDHHFKFPQHRQPGDLHLHYFGTSKLSYGQRDWTYEDGDVVQIEAPAFSSALVNTIRVQDRTNQTPVGVQPG